VSDEEFARLTRADGKAREHDRVFGQIRELGFDSTEAALEALARHKAITDNPQMSGVLDALSQPEHEPSPQTTPQAMTPEQFNQLFDERLQARDAAEFQQRFTADQQTEAGLLAEALKDESLKPVFGETSFDDAIGGKGTPLARGYAVLWEQAMMERAEQVNGQFMPITDAAKIQDAHKQVQDFIQEIRTQAIFDLSKRASGGLNRPEGEPVRPSEDVLDEPVSANDFLQKMGDAAEATAAAEMARLSKVGLPASQ
jgi:hypothetical protein